jgi:hypothetical protein
VKIRSKPMIAYSNPADDANLTLRFLSDRSKAASGQRYEWMAASRAGRGARHWSIMK